jgi:predicted nucleic acid-binding protein
VSPYSCGNLADRPQVLRLLGSLPTAPRATDDEVLHFIKQHRLMGRGIGHIDAHLLAATALAADARLWTRDTRLARTAATLGLAWQTPH